MLINWQIAGNPVNWIKIGLMAAIFLFGVELIAGAVIPEKDALPPDTVSS